ncbi:hypothetical protein [Streptomyces flavofungini]|uniref:hypothetical protein n=1 Tax=Streptomyces flavofungini TaxID=68200 RepID=UPI0025AFDD8D|nr:hypothetical protein [Streptomyces flavofungini]WJV51713.1 hypothetical protein QUY26_40350 [Streptomyces flavofungini]
MPDGAPAGATERRTAHCYAPDSPYRLRSLTITVSAEPFDMVRDTVREASPYRRSMIQQGRITPAVARLRAQVLCENPEDTDGAAALRNS